GITGAAITSFYMFRLLFLTFFGAPRYDEHHVHVHESPRNMTVPLMILAFFSIFGGWLAAPKLTGGIDYFEKFLRPVFSSQVAPISTEEPAASPAIGLLHAVAGWPVIVAVLGLLLAWWLYIKNPNVPERLAQSLRGL